MSEREKQKENSRKIIESFRGSSQEWGMLWGVLNAQHEIPELRGVYDSIVIAERLDELKAEIVKDLHDED